MKRRLQAVVAWSGLSDVAIAQRVKRSGDWVGRHVRGTTDVLADDLGLFAAALRVDPCVFLDDERVDQLIGGRIPSRQPPTPAATTPAYVPSGAERMTREWMDYLDEELADVSDQEEREEIEALTQLLERKISRARRKQQP